jgi:hypothetical protein
MDGDKDGRSSDSVNENINKEDSIMVLPHGVKRR